MALVDRGLSWRTRWPVAIEIGAKQLDGGSWERVLTQSLQQTDRQGVDFLPGGTARHPHPQGGACGFCRQQTRQDLLCKRLEGGGVPKKTRHADQHILVQGLHFGLMVGEIGQVLGKMCRYCKSAMRRWMRRSSVAGLYAVKSVSVLLRNTRRICWNSGSRVGTARPRGSRLLLRLCHWRLADIRMATDPGQFPGNCFRRPDEIHASGSNGTLRHPSKLRRGGVLGKGHAPLGLDGLESQRPIGSRSRQNHPNGPSGSTLGQRTQKRINGEMLSPRLCPGHEVAARSAKASCPYWGQ